MLNRLISKNHIRLSFEEFFALERNEITIEEIVWKRKIDKFAGNVLNSKYKMVIIFLIASGLVVLNTATVFATTIDTSKIDVLGSTILGLIRSCGYWFCIVLATKDIIAALMEGSTKQIGGIVIKYLTAFGAFYALPWIMDLIKDLLS